MDDSGHRSGPRGRRIPERWRTPLLDLALWAVLAALTLAELSGAPSHSTAVEGTVALMVLAIGLQRRFPHLALTAVTAYAAVQAVFTGLGVTSTTILVVPYLCVSVSAFRAGLLSDRPRPIVTLAVVTTAAMFAVYAASEMVSGYDTRAFLSATVGWASTALAVVLSLVTPWLFGRYRRWQKRVEHDGWEVAERMERTRAAETDRARLLERARIASRMHDSLGHDLALIAVRAAALEMAAQEGQRGSGTGSEDGRDSPGQREAAAELRAAAHEANLRLREVIGVLREEPEGSEEGEGSEETEGAPAETVSDLVERAADAGLSIRLLREGPDPDPRSPGGRTAHRIVQEAVTNAAKYAPGAEVSVRVVRGGGVTRVVVEDSGTTTGSALPARSGGHEGTRGGLAELRSLVVKGGGGFEAGPVRGMAGNRESAGNGFVVRAVLPDSPDFTGLTDPADLTDTSGPAASQTHRLHAEASGRARRSLFTAVVVPTVIGLLAVGVVFLLLWWMGTGSVLPQERYERLSVGDPRAAVEAELPRFAYPAGSVAHPPPTPEDADECRYYLATWDSGLPPVYRLCFGDGVLIAKEEIERTE